MLYYLDKSKTAEDRRTYSFKLSADVRALLDRVVLAMSYKTDEAVLLSDIMEEFIKIAVQNEDKTLFINGCLYSYKDMITLYEDLKNQGLISDDGKLLKREPEVPESGWLAYGDLGKISEVDSNKITELGSDIPSNFNNGTNKMDNF